MANTTTDKLNKILNTKADIKAALAEKGQTVGDVFSTYGDAVRAIETGSPKEYVEVWGQAERMSNTYVYYVLDGEPKSAYVPSVGGSRMYISDVDKNTIICVTSISSAPLSAVGDCQVLKSGSGYVCVFVTGETTFGHNL